MKKFVLGGVLLLLLITVGCGSSSGPAETVEPEETYPDLVVTSLEVTAWTADSIDYSYTITNVGDAAVNLDGPTDDDADNVSVQAVLSADTVFAIDVDLAAGGTIVGSSPLGELGPGESMTGTFSAGATVDREATPYLVLMVDWGGVVGESNEDNNTLAVEIPSLTKPDLEVTDLYIAWTADSITYEYTITNNGVGTVNLGETETLTVQASLSGDNRLNDWDSSAGSAILDASQINLGPGESFTGTITADVAVDLEATPYLILLLDSTGVVDESDEDNNIFPARVDGQGLPDLQVTVLEVTAWTPEFITCSYTIINAGNAAADLTGVTVQGYLSGDEGDTPLEPDALPTELAAGGTFEGSFTKDTSETPIDGDITPNLILVVDSSDVLDESNEANNTMMAELGAEGAVDLAVTSFTVESGANDKIYISYTIENTGNITAILEGDTEENNDNVTAQVYLSADKVFNAEEDLSVATYPLENLLPGESVSPTAIERDEPIDRVQYQYFILVVDAGNVVEEASEDNNMREEFIPKDKKPDLVVGSVEIVRLLGRFIRFRYTITNIGADYATMDGYIGDGSDNLSVKAVLSDDDVLSEDDITVNEGPVGESPMDWLAPQESRTFEIQKRMDESIDTTVTPNLIITVDTGGLVDESDETNNSYTFTFPIQ